MPGSSESSLRDTESIMLDEDRKAYIVAIDAFRFSGGYSFVEIFRTLWAQKFWIVIAGLVGAFAGLSLSFMATKKYEATTTVIWADSGRDGSNYSGLGGGLGSLAAATGLLPDGEAAKKEALAILRSRVFTQRFIQGRNLLPVLFESEWDQETQNWRSSSQDDPPSLADAFELFDQKIRTIEERIREGVIDVSVEWHDPEVAADWANELIDRVNELIRQQRIEEANSSLGFLQTELEAQDNIQLRNAIFRMMESQLNTIMVAQVQPDFAFRVIDPATAPDTDKFSSPNRYIFLLLGGLIGGLVAICIVLFRRTES